MAATEAAASGHLHVLEWLYLRQHRVCWEPNITRKAVGSGILPVVRLLIQRFPPVSVKELFEVLLVSLVGGHTEITEFLWGQVLQLQPSQTYVSTAVSRASLSLAKWMLRDPTVGPPIISIDFAARRGDIDFVQWAQYHRSIATFSALDYAAASEMTTR
ncbi:hypothetical protein L914_10989 [Phytophthora nicotianae]|nr:hypothetical protein L914_10989 [Phytophthora nicotianae]ETO72343.1 hypothetical protein F444_11533 [Phytophthora nicotianae P1976]